MQKNAYISQLSGIVTDGSIALGVSQFSDVVQEVFALTAITSTAVRDSLIAALTGMTQIGSLTAIGDSINAAGLALTSFGIDCSADAIKCLIDVSTDGVNNTGADPNTAADAIVALGVDQVNCIGVGRSANCGFFAGTGSFSVSASSFADFEAVLKTKLEREGVIDGAVPLPAAGWLLLAGMGGLAAAARRKKAA